MFLTVVIICIVLGLFLPFENKLAGIILCLCGALALFMIGELIYLPIATFL